MSKIDYSKLKENEPNLGPAWALVMLMLYLLKRAFPAEQYTWLWYLQVYVLGIVFVITVLVIAKRYFFFRNLAKNKSKEQPED